MDDKQIIALYFHRDEQAIQETRWKYGRFLYGIANNILSNNQDSEECVSDTYFAAWNQIPPTRPKYLGAFLGNIVRNLSIDRWRKIHAEKRGRNRLSIALTELEPTVAGNFNMETEMQQRELTEILDRFLHTLSAQDRRIFICRYWYLDTIPQISQQYNLPQTKVKSALVRCRKKLKTYLAEKGVVQL